MNYDKILIVKSLILFKTRLTDFRLIGTVFESCNQKKKKRTWFYTNSQQAFHTNTERSIFFFNHMYVCAHKSSNAGRQIETCTWGSYLFRTKKQIFVSVKTTKLFRILFPTKAFLPVTRRSKTITSGPIPIVLKILGPRRFQIHHSRTHRRNGTRPNIDSKRVS